MNSQAPQPAPAVDAQAMWRNDTPVIWDDIQAPKWQANRTAWLLTCVDLTSLLVGFFVLFFSTQSLQRDQWQALNGGFQARFAPKAVVVEMVPDGAANAVVRPVVVASGLAYLDTLLRQRMQGDPVWGALNVVDENRELHYALPEAAMSGADVDAAWGRLGGVVRGWKNPVGVRVLANRVNAQQATQKAIALAGKLSNSGVMGAFADVKIDDATTGTVAQLVVRVR